MKKILFISIAAAVFINLQVFSEPVKEPKYMSERHDYSKLLLINSEELILSFDESQGTDTGYDTLYADINFNKDLIDDKSIMINNKAFDLMNFNSNSITYSIKIYRSVSGVMKFKTTKDGVTERVLEKFNFVRASVSVTISEKDLKWGYMVSPSVMTNVDFNKTEPLKLFNKNIKLAIASKVNKKGEQSLLSVSVTCFDENNKKIAPPAITKNGQKITPLLTVENEKGEIILNASLKPG